MNRMIVTAMTVAMLTATASAIAEEGCSQSTLRGTMAWSATATRNGVASSSSGFEAYDGAGNLKYTEIWSDGYHTYSYTGTGTYTLGANCIAYVTYDGAGPAFQYFVAPSGEAYW